MRKIIFFLAINILLISGHVYAENNTITCSTEIIDKQIFINGQLPNATQKNQVSLLVGSIDNILYIDQVESSDQGDFQFSFKFPEGTPIGDYEFRIGNDAGADPYQGVIHYGEKRQFADMNISIDINQYVPTLSGSISCIADKSIILRIENITDNIIIAEDTIHAEDGAHEISYQLPSLLQAKAFNVSVICNDDSSKQAELNLEIDSSVLLVSASGTIELSDGTSISMHAQSVNSNLIDKQIEFTDSRTLSATLPNIVGNSAYTITADLYEEFFSSAEEEETTITAAASVNENIVTINGQISSGQDQLIHASVYDPNNAKIHTKSLYSGDAGNFSFNFSLDQNATSGVYTVVLENDFVINSFQHTFLYEKSEPSNPLPTSSGDTVLFNTSMSGTFSNNILQKQFSISPKYPMSYQFSKNSSVTANLYQNKYGTSELIAENLATGSKVWLEYPGQYYLIVSTESAGNNRYNFSFSDTKSRKTDKKHSVTVGADEYYISIANQGKLYKNGSVVESCSHTNITWLIATNQNLYYCTGNAIYQLSGTNETKLLDNVLAYYLVTDGNNLYYVNWSDDGAIYRYSFSDASNVCVCRDAAAWLELKEDKIYYLNQKDSNKTYYVPKNSINISSGTAVTMN